MECIKEFKNSEVYILISVESIGLGFSINWGDASIIFQLYLGLIYISFIRYRRRYDG